MRIEFLWAKFDNDPRVRDRSICWYEEGFSLSHHKNRVSTFLPCFIVALRHTAEIFSESGLPYFHRDGVVY